MNPENKTMETIDRAELLLREGKYREAIELFEKIHQANPEEESVLLKLAWAHYDNGNTDKASQYLENLLDRELQRRIFTGFAFDELVRIYKQERKFDNLIQICNKAVKAQPDDIGLSAELGAAFLHAGKPEDACRIFEKLTVLENDNPAFYCRWGEALFAAEKISESRDAYLQASKIDPDDSDRYTFQLASLFQNAGNSTEARTLIEKCISINPANPLYYCFLGDVLVFMGQTDEAVNAYKTAAQCDNTSAGIYYNRLGHTFMKAKYFAQAVEAFKSAIAFDAKTPYYRGLASAYEALGYIDMANEILQKKDTPN